MSKRLHEGKVHWCRPIKEEFCSHIANRSELVVEILLFKFEILVVDVHEALFIDENPLISIRGSRELRESRKQKG